MRYNSVRTLNAVKGSCSESLSHTPHSHPCSRSLTMPLLLREVSQDIEFNEIIQCECESFRTPLKTFFRIFRYDDSPAGFIELRDRQIRAWRNDPTSRWFKVVDTEIGNKVVGAANWNTFTENPYATEAQRSVEVDWWPGGKCA